MPMNRRTLLVLVVSAAVVLSVAAGTVLLLQRETLEIRVTDVGMVPNLPGNGMTQLHADLVLRNVGSSPVHFAWVTLFAYDPDNSTLYDTFTHEGIQLGSGKTLAFSETTNITGHWSQVAFTVKVFPAGAPSWERSLVPDQPLTWTAW
jgi:hypothetical protein